MTLVPPPISRSQFRNRPISKTAGFETGVAVRGLSQRLGEVLVGRCHEYNEPLGIFTLEDIA